MFATCPACKQSVLEDDAEHCPFCGASMKGGASKAPPPKVATKPAAPKAATSASTPTASSKPSAKSAPSKPKDAADDDPFGVDAAASSRAIALSPRPAKGKTLRLICPMCEATGFASADVAGKEVKCCNEKCPLPIFTAPRADAEAAHKAASGAHPMGNTTRAAAKKSNPALVVAAVATAVLAAGSVWYFEFKDPMANAQKAAPAPSGPSSSTGNVAANNLAGQTNQDDKKKVVKTPQERAVELRSQILSVMVDVSRVTEKNRSKPYCRRLTAEACVEAGDIKGARENLEQLLKVGQKLGFHQVPPLTQIAWRETKASDAAAKTTLDETLKAAADLPGQGRLTFDSTTDLAALLFLSGRAADAKALLRTDRLPPGYRGTLAVLMRRAQLLQNYNLDQATASLPVIPWKSPQWVATTITLVLRGESAKGLQWANLTSDPEVKADSLAAWADAFVAVPKSVARDDDEPIAAAVNAESPALQARVWSRVATARAALGLKDAAAKALAKAAQAIAAEAPPADFVLPEMKELTRLDLPNALVPRLNAIAAAEVARAQTLLGQNAAAAATLAAALQHLRGHAPSPFAAQNRVDAITREQSVITAQLKKAFDLKTDEQVRQTFTQYRAKCRAVLDAATARFTLQTDILSAALDWPLVDEVWNEATSHSGNSTPEESREDFLKSRLSVRLGKRLRAAGETDKARLCESTAEAGEFIDPRDEIEQETAEAAEKGNVAAIAKRLASYQPPKAEGSKPAPVLQDDLEWPLLWAMRLTSRMTLSGKSDKALELVAVFPDFLWREEGYELVADIVARDLSAIEPLWKKHRAGPLTPTERIAMFRGFCNGLTLLAE